MRSHRPPCRILLVDDHPMMRRGIAQLLEVDGEFEVVGQASDGQTLLEQVNNLHPELILLDYNMPLMNGLQALRRLREQGYQGKVLLYTVSDAEEDLRDALRAGADGYLLKDMEPERLVQCLHAARDGELVVSPSLVSALVRALKPEPANVDSSTLNNKERQLLKLLIEGHSNRVIGERLGITESQVKQQVKAFVQKLGVRSRVEAVVWGLENSDRLSTPAGTADQSCASPQPRRR